MLARLCIFALAVTLYFIAAHIEAADLDPNNFDRKVIEDDAIWVVEFYSAMCGSCQEFAPTWERLEDSLKSLRTGKINIDAKEGLELAERLGVLEEGIPSIRVFAVDGERKGRSILSGDAEPEYKKIMRTLKKIVAGLSKHEGDGFYRKRMV